MRPNNVDYLKNDFSRTDEAKNSLKMLFKDQRSCNPYKHIFLRTN